MRFHLWSLVGATMLLGCASVIDKRFEAEEAYRAEQMKCVDDNDTKAAIDSCRDRVKADWTRKDAGR